MPAKDAKTKGRLKAGAKERAPLKNETVLTKILEELKKNPDPQVIIGRVESSSAGTFKVSQYSVRAKGDLALTNMISQAFKDTKLSPDLWPLIVFVKPLAGNSGEALAIITSQKHLDDFRSIGVACPTTYVVPDYEFEEEVDVDAI